MVHTTDAVLYAPGKVEAFRGIGVASDSGIKALFHGRLRSSLPETTGTVVGTKELAGRSCWAVEAIWRSDDQSVALRLAIDQETGFVLEIVRPDMPEALIWVESIEIGTVTSDSSWQPKGPEHFPEEPPPPLPGQPFAVSPSMTDAELRNALFGDELTNPADSP